MSELAGEWGPALFQNCCVPTGNEGLSKAHLELPAHGLPDRPHAAVHGPRGPAAVHAQQHAPGGIVPAAAVHRLRREELDVADRQACDQRDDEIGGGPAQRLHHLFSGACNQKRARCS